MLSRYTHTVKVNEYPHKTTFTEARSSDLAIVAGSFCLNTHSGAELPSWLLSLYWTGLRRADHSSKESYRLCKEDYETEEEARAQQRAVDSLMDEWILDRVIRGFTQWLHTKVTTTLMRNPSKVDTCIAGQETSGISRNGECQLPWLKEVNIWPIP
jgi:hypothetical protein